MKQCATLVLFLLILFSANISFGQPADVHYGCRHTKSQFPLRTLTPAEIDQMNESNARSDTVDILNYDITLDITDFGGKSIKGSCAIQLTPKVDGVDSIKLDLLDLNIDSITLDAQHLNYMYDGNILTIAFPQLLNTTDTAEVVVFYGGVTTVAASGFGGMAFQENIAYNLGIGLGENPYNFGRGWFPCFDNFVERATYDLNIISNGGRKAYCIGTFLEEAPWEEDKIIRRYRMGQLLPTYLVGVAVSDYVTANYTHQGIYGEHPIQLVAKPGQLADMENSFEYLPDAIDAFEAWFGPYIWERIGFVLTPVGAMEHCTNIAFPIASGTAGPVAATNRLMAHEFAHHWWGNQTTLSTPSNMWIKEGNSEYGAHLFTEFAFGKEAFQSQVKSNQLRILKNAHLEDDGYHPLSGIPYEHTYGMHTYQKGAAMIHNMRGYMGDTLFSIGQKAVLETFTYQSIDAEQYRDRLTEATGLDMTSYFEDWIFSPGYANYELESMTSTPNGGSFDITLSIQQKLHNAPHFHTNAPVAVTFFAADWSTETVQFMASGELTTGLSTSLPFEPIFAIINHQQELNLARMNAAFPIYEAGSLGTSFIEFLALAATEVPDSAFVNIVHHWTAPDQPADEPGIQMSSTHYWSVRGDFPEGFNLAGNLQYKGGVGQFDEDLAGISGADLILAWRPDIDSDWQEYPTYNKISQGISGFIQINPLLPGDYAFANGEFIMTDTEEQLEIDADIQLLPNPAHELATVKIKLAGKAQYLQLNVYNMNGQLVEQQALPTTTAQQVSFQVADWPAGMYVVEVRADEFSKTVELLVQK